MDLDILSLNPIESWPPEKKRMWERLQILAPRIIEKQVDITSDLGSDFFTIKMTFALFAQAKEANTLYHKVCALAPSYNYDHCEDAFKKAAEKTKFKTLKKLLEICRYHGIDTSFEDEPVPQDKQSEYLPEGVDETQFDTYGFFEHKNQYFTLEKSGNGWKPVSFTNFKMKVLYHMENGMKPKRTIEITNIKGKSKRVDVETDKLVSKNEFKKLCEGYGNYRFFGSDGKLDMLKAYLYEQECPAFQITELGWHEDGFWCWSNGLFNSKFWPTDHNGHVELHGKHYIIPAGNMDVPGRNGKFNNQIRFRHFADHQVTFTEWADLYCKVFTTNGAIILTFAVASLFSSIVFSVKQFFPLLFVYGEGGSGKGSAIKMAQRLFGIPQDPLTLAGKANTEKSKIALFAQFIDTMLLLEEYVPAHDIDQQLKNIWDRYGYKRRTMDMGYNTETVPIQSTAAITSNFTPQDDPLLQRMIYLDHNSNQFTIEQGNLFSKLKEFSEKGVTSCTHELLSKRTIIESKYRDAHQDIYREIKSKNSALANCTDRMIENVTVLATIYTLLSEANIVFPFTREHLIDELVKNTIRQNEKRDSGGDIQVFFDIFQFAVSRGDLIEDTHFKIDKRHLYFNVKMVYGVFADLYRKQKNMPALTLTNLRDKLKIHPSYSGYEDSTRIGRYNTSAFLFHYDKLGIDLIAAGEVFKGMRRSSNGINESYQDKLDRGKGGYQPAIDGPMI
jgi:hypothetical protein